MRIGSAPETAASVCQLLLSSSVSLWLSAAEQALGIPSLSLSADSNLSQVIYPFKPLLVHYQGSPGYYLAGLLQTSRDDG